MENIIEVMMASVMLLIGIVSYRISNRLYKDSKDRFKTITGMDYDKYEMYNKIMNKINGKT